MHTGDGCNESIPRVCLFDGDCAVHAGIKVPWVGADEQVGAGLTRLPRDTTALIGHDHGHRGNDCRVLWQIVGLIDGITIDLGGHAHVAVNNHDVVGQARCVLEVDG